MSSPPASQRDVRDFGVPFDDTDADIILRSCEQVDFRVYKIILSKASQTFKDMFTAQPNPPPPTSSDDANYRNGIPVIPLTETTRALEIMLKLFYPTDRPLLSGVDDIRLALGALAKYMADGFSETINNSLLTLAEEDPGTVYALACRYSLPAVAKGAALRSLDRSTPTSSISDDDLSHMTGLQYRRLLLYREHCIQAAVDVSQKFSWIAGADIPGATPENDHVPDNCTCFRSRRVVSRSRGSGSPYAFASYFLIPKWILDYMAQSSAALRLKPCGKSVLDPMLIASALELASVCNGCKIKAMDQMHKFSKKLSEQVDCAVGKVVLQPSF
ncbi:hypothetical protein DENSPDRAFT_835929 [Dentipellis sp. KUC8613]|nr:hypothetical protein DENSPDRAFT_835929 [Dentipellis sp. KUC8613]